MESGLFRGQGVIAGRDRVVKLKAHGIPVPHDDVAAETQARISLNALLTSARVLHEDMLLPDWKVGRDALRKDIRETKAELRTCAKRDRTHLGLSMQSLQSQLKDRQGRIKATPVESEQLFGRYRQVCGQVLKLQIEDLFGVENVTEKLKALGALLDFNNKAIAKLLMRPRAIGLEALSIRGLAPTETDEMQVARSKELFALLKMHEGSAKLAADVSARIARLIPVSIGLTVSVDEPASAPAPLPLAPMRGIDPRTMTGPIGSVFSRDEQAGQIFFKTCCEWLLTCGMSPIPVGFANVNLSVGLVQALNEFGWSGKPWTSEMLTQALHGYRNRNPSDFNRLKNLLDSRRSEFELLNVEKFNLFGYMAMSLDLNFVVVVFDQEQRKRNSYLFKANDTVTPVNTMSLCVYNYGGGVFVGAVRMLNLDNGLVVTDYKDFLCADRARLALAPRKARATKAVRGALVNVRRSRYMNNHASDVAVHLSLEALGLRAVPGSCSGSLHSALASMLNLRQYRGGKLWTEDYVGICIVNYLVANKAALIALKGFPIDTSEKFDAFMRSSTELQVQAFAAGLCFGINIVMLSASGDGLNMRERTYVTQPVMTRANVFCLFLYSDIYVEPTQCLLRDSGEVDPGYMKFLQHVATESARAPAPVPVPVSAPAPVAARAPAPVPARAPAPVPVSAPVPARVPAPVPVSAPVPVAARAPVPVSVPAPASARVPVPVSVPGQTRAATKATLKKSRADDPSAPDIRAQKKRALARRPDPVALTPGLVGAAPKFTVLRPERPTKLEQTQEQLNVWGQLHLVCGIETYDKGILIKFFVKHSGGDTVPEGCHKYGRNDPFVGVSLSFSSANPVAQAQYLRSLDTGAELVARVLPHVQANLHAIEPDSIDVSQSRAGAAKKKERREVSEHFFSYDKPKWKALKAEVKAVCQARLKMAEIGGKVVLPPASGAGAGAGGQALAFVPKPPAASAFVVPPGPGE